MALEVVLADGSVVRTGGRARKSSSGYQLTRLFCGAEGTLGVITELTVRLTPRPAHVMGARASFGTVGTCVEYVTELVQSGVAVARCELVDAPTIGAIDRHLGLDLAVAHTVFLEFHGDEHSTGAGVAVALDLARQHGAGTAEAARDGAELNALWRARHQAFYCLTAAHPGMNNLVTDLAVPVSRLAEVIEASRRVTAAAGLPTYVLGHVGDGNFHLTLFFAPDDAPAEEAAMAAHAELVGLTLAAGGTSSGEHGIGFRKLPYVRAEHGSAVEVMWAIKQALDPLGILNPGKKLPQRVQDPTSTR
jgi:D-lactate dehydrogenase (cytochrome)